MRHGTIIGLVALSGTSGPPSSVSFQDVLQCALFEVYLTIEVSRCIAACDAGSWQETAWAGKGKTYEENNRHSKRLHSLRLLSSIYPPHRSLGGQRHAHDIGCAIPTHSNVNVKESLVCCLMILKFYTFHLHESRVFTLLFTFVLFVSPVLLRRYAVILSAAAACHFLSLVCVCACVCAHACSEGQTEKHSHFLILVKQRGNTSSGLL